MTDIAATWMRGGTSKGVFFAEADLPRRAAERDALLLRVIGSPDPYERQTDGLGGATSSTSKVVLVAPTFRDDCDIDYLFGAVSITDPLIDYSGNCGNLTAAVAPFAIHAGLVPAVEPLTHVRMWQRNLGQRIDAYVPVRHGRVLEQGAFQEDGVPFPSAEIRLEYFGATAGTKAPAILPTGNVTDTLEVPGVGELEVTMVTAGNPTVFVRATDIGLTGRELPGSFNSKLRKLGAGLEAIRAHAAVAMGLAETPEIATHDRPATPKLSWVAPPSGYRASSGREVAGNSIDVLARIMSMGKLHHAYTGTGSVALGVAAAVPGSVVNRIARALPGVPIRIGHVSGTLSVGAELSQVGKRWVLDKALMSRSARRMMSGHVHLPD